MPRYETGEQKNNLNLTPTILQRPSHALDGCNARIKPQYTAGGELATMFPNPFDRKHSTIRQSFTICVHTFRYINKEMDWNK
ncbi:unnamed protein product, partial [Iphiclides podalirius]